MVEYNGPAAHYTLRILLCNIRYKLLVPQAQVTLRYMVRPSRALPKRVTGKARNPCKGEALTYVQFY